MEQDQPNRYAVIPAEVRHDDRLSSGAKLLYGEITAFADERRICAASNNCFAKLYNTNIRTIKRWIASLKKYGFIKDLGKNDKGERQLTFPYI